MTISSRELIFESPLITDFGLGGGAGRRRTGREKWGPEDPVDGLRTGKLPGMTDILRAASDDNPPVSSTDTCVVVRDDAEPQQVTFLRFERNLGILGCSD
ncbi:hypothetical protein Zmor_008514 [Zophobas morio]|uniref:Uncharacterized protein n=1 Tax=Zophobas morio TaxID=2755281 RepID=A0AA38IVB7_9CUCU|nr:hypothetical protein Zmor_008514 [Zophobas morio]